MPELFPRMGAKSKLLVTEIHLLLRRILFNKDVSLFSRITIYTDVFHFCSYDWTIRVFSPTRQLPKIRNSSWRYILQFCSFDAAIDTLFVLGTIVALEVLGVLDLK